MKKSIIAIAFLLLCPFYGVRAQERPFFDLSGKGWHLWQDKKATWQTEDCNNRLWWEIYNLFF